MFLKALLTSTALAQSPEPAPSLPIEINAVRQTFDVPQLVSTQGLDCAAQMHAVDLAKTNRCDNEGSDGSTFSERAELCGTEAHAQIVACGFLNPKPVVERWVRDRMSRQIILNADNLAMGTAHVGNKWVIIFQIEPK